MTAFASSQEIFDAGYALMVYGIDPAKLNWQYRNEFYQTPRLPSGLIVQNQNPAIVLARIDDVRARAI